MLGKPSKDAFAQTIIDAARKAGETREIRYDRDAFRLVIGNDSGQQFNLQNVYGEYASADAAKQETLLDGYVQMILTSESAPIPRTFAGAQERLLPRVRERAYHGLTKLYCEVEGQKLGEVAHRPLSDYLTVELVYDQPHAIHTVLKSTLDDWHVGLDAALDLAIENLLAATEPEFDSPVPGLYVSAWKDNYDASRLVLTDLLRSLRVKGEHVAMVPHRDLFIVTGSEDIKGLEQMANLSDQAMSEARFMTAIPVRLESDRWIPFRPPEGHPLRNRFDLLRAQSILRDYSEQKDLLDKLNELTSEGAFVASYVATQDEKTGKIRTYCTWSKGVETLLPIAEKVYFFDDGKPEDQRLVGVPWERVREVAGHLMKKQDLCPPRFLVRDFPEAAMLQGMVDR